MFGVTLLEPAALYPAVVVVVLVLLWMSLQRQGEASRAEARRRELDASAATSDPDPPEEVRGERMDAAEFLSRLAVTAEEVARLLDIPQRYPDGRAHPSWLDARRNRLTASRFASACGLADARSSPKAVAADMLALPEGHAKQAQRFGIQHEEVARQAYVRQRRAGGRKGAPGPSVEVREVGICVHPAESWLAASPDGVCWEDGRPVGLLEVKTSKQWSAETERRLSGDLPADWLYQIQGGLRIASAALGVELCWCDLFLWAPEQGRCRRVPYDAQLWERLMYPRLRAFYFQRFVPLGVERMRAQRRLAEAPGRQAGPKRRKGGARRR